MTVNHFCTSCTLPITIWFPVTFLRGVLFLLPLLVVTSGYHQPRSGLLASNFRLFPATSVILQSLFIAYSQLPFTSSNIRYLTVNLRLFLGIFSHYCLLTVAFRLFPATSVSLQSGYGRFQLFPSYSQLTVIFNYFQSLSVAYS